MMDYREYSFQELAQDPLFRKWVFKADKDIELFWNTWIKQNPDQEKKVAAARALLLTLEVENTDFDEEELDEVVATVFRKAKTSARISVMRRIAASVALLVTVGLGIFWGLDQNKFRELSEKAIDEVILDNYEEIANNQQSNRLIKLEDGSTITLYPESRLKYARDFKHGERVVYLTGKALFDVSKDAGRPFWVLTEDISTQVLGTSFMVSAIENTKETNVEVSEGKVLVYTRKDLNSAKKDKKSTLTGVMLTRNQKVSFSKDDPNLVRTIIAEPILTENAGKVIFKFEEEPIANVFSRLEQAYGIPVNFDTQVMSGCFVTANLEDENLYRKLDLICSLSRSSYEIVDGQIIIYSKGC